MDDRVRKRRLVVNRVLGIVISFAIIAMLLFYLFDFIDQWVLGINVLMLSGIDFMINAAIIQAKETSIWARASAFASAILFIFGAVIVIYGLISGNLVLF